MKLPSDDEFATATIRKANAGDTAAAWELIRLCRNGLESNNLNEPLRKHLTECLSRLLEDREPRKGHHAFLLNRRKGRPVEPFPDWQESLGIFSAILKKRGYKPSQVVAAMCNARSGLDEADANRIATAHAPAADWDEADLIPLAGPYRRKIDDFPPTT